jgi:hypothetical protein
MSDGTSPDRTSRVYVPLAPALSQALELREHAYDRWSFDDDLTPLVLRAPSPASDGRVKAFRKLARDHTLPPVVLWYVTGLQRYIVIDGHERLHAALLEGIAPRCLAVLDLSAAPADFDARKAAAIANQVGQMLDGPSRDARRKSTLEIANRLLVKAFDTRDRLVVTTRAWKLDGGIERWTAEVRARPASAEYATLLLDA